jgi:hypothetical protein
MPNNMEIKNMNCTKSSHFLNNSRHIIETKGTCLVASNYNIHPSTKKRLRRMFHRDYGDIPVMAVLCSDSSTHGYTFFAVENSRGHAYGLRNAKRYRKAKFLKLKNSFIG